ncbi:unnamed protein product [Owenia fusiformis]|uniref:Sedoheptulokinase n=1 Tax=Owenia fusiformis TaxID=6347 RepID=A0A8J1XLU8_OWEFU|nr:unnamed protein product [Owenia fusiformis]
MRTLVLGIDIGTTSIKVALVDTSGNQVIAEATRNTEANIQTSQDREYLANEQDVQKIIISLQICLSALPKHDLLDVKHIGICGQMHGVLLWQRNGAWKHNAQYKRFDIECKSTSNLVTWQDGRCDEAFLSTLPSPESNCPISTGYGCATLFWLQRHSRETIQSYDCAGTIQDFVVAMLCNLHNPVMSEHNAASWGYYNTSSQSWNTAILERAGFPTPLLPDVVSPGTEVGRLQRDWYTIPQGASVHVALGDMQCSIYSCLKRDNDAALNISTSTQLAYCMPDGFVPPNKDVAEVNPVTHVPYFEGRFIAVAASLTGGNALAAFVKMLQQWIHDLGINGIPQSEIWNKVTSLGETSPDTNLNIKPTLYGERHDPNHNASVEGITTGNIGLGSVYRALCKGVINNLYSMMSRDDLRAASIDRVIGVGTALSKNPALGREFETLYDVKVVSGGGADAATGVALATMKHVSCQQN